MLLLTNERNAKNGSYSINVRREIDKRHVYYTFDVKQTREKYKRCVQIWREAVIKLKIKMGIKRFQKEEASCRRHVEKKM